MSEDQRQRWMNNLAGDLWIYFGFNTPCPVVRLGNIVVDEKSVYLDDCQEAEQGILGHYDEVSNHILINRPYTDDIREVAEVVTHEVRHAFQYQHIQRLNNNQACDERTSTWRREFRNKPNVLRDGALAFLFDCEKDADAFAAQLIQDADL